jgi:maltose-binding protein MalE
LNADLRGDERYAALLFMGFMLAREVQSVLARIDHIPAVLDVNVESAWMRQAMQAFEGGAAYPADPALQAYWDPLDAAIQAVCESDADPQAALQAAYDDILEKLK